MDTIASSVSVPGTPAPSRGNGHGRIQKRHAQDDAAASVQAAQFAMRIAQLLPDAIIGTQTAPLPAAQSTTGVAQISPDAGNVMNTEPLPDRQSSEAVGITTTTDNALETDGGYQSPAKSTDYPSDAGIAGLHQATPIPQLAVLADGGPQTTDSTDHATAVLPSKVSSRMDIASHTPTTVAPDQNSTQTIMDSTPQHESPPLQPSREMSYETATTTATATATTTTTTTAATTTTATAAIAPGTAPTNVAGLADEFATRVTQFEQAGGSWTGNARITFRSNVWNGASVHIAGSINLLTIVVTPPPLAQAASASLSSGTSALGLGLRQEKQLAADLSRKLGRAISVHITEAQETEDGPQAMGNATAHSETR